MSDPADAPLDFDVSQWPAARPADGLFVVGTARGVGCTLTAGAVARHLRRKKRKVEPLVPVAAGCRRTREGLVSPAAEFLAACADARLSLTDIAPVRLGPDAPPNVAAGRAGRPVDPEDILRAYRFACSRANTLVVDGGELLRPLTDEFWTIHLARILALPLLIVTTAERGALNHTLLTLHAARSARLRLAGVVINRYLLSPPGPGPENVPRELDAGAELTMETARDEVAARGRAKVLAVLPEDPGNRVADARIGDDTQYAVDQVDWLGLLRAGDED